MIGSRGGVLRGKKIKIGMGTEYKPKCTRVLLACGVAGRAGRKSTDTYVFISIVQQLDSASI